MCMYVWFLFLAYPQLSFDLSWDCLVFLVLQDDTYRCNITPFLIRILKISVSNTRGCFCYTDWIVDNSTSLHYTQCCLFS